MSDKGLTHKYHRHLKSISGHFTDTFILRKYKSEKNPGWITIFSEISF